jgi:hypothetical protein
VSIPCRYEPGVQRTHEGWAARYGSVILPARPQHPKDKAMNLPADVAELHPARPPPGDTGGGDDWMN